MAKLVVEGYGTFEVPEGKRLVRAMEDSGVDILHRCGGYAKCTTCRVEFLAGEPQMATVAEYDRLRSGGLLGRARLSCQCHVEDGMHLRPLKTLSNSEFDDPGRTPEDEITPDPVWIQMKMTE